jgi:sec-independent protein translocase protein TatC
MSSDRPRYITEHLVELRKGLIHSLVVAAIGVGLAFWRSDWLFSALLKPFKDVLGKFPDVNQHVQTLQTLAPIEAFMINMKLATMVGLALASPFILREIWVFAAPALKSNERFGILMVFCLGLFFFSGGLAFGYYLVVPLALQFLIHYNLDYNFLPQWTLQGYFNFVVNFLLIFGLVFELPLVLAGLVSIGVATPAYLAHLRKHAIIAIFILSAFIAPSADPITQTIVAVPLIVLYEVGIWLSYLAVWKKS